MRSTLLLVVVFLLPLQLDARWDLMKQFAQPVSCGFFFDVQRGIIGTCNNQSNGTPQIWRTSDGGVSWQRSTTPTASDARLTSIFMKDQSIGYASVMVTNKSSFTGDDALWKTTDGGRTWFDHTQGSEFSATCVYATSSALIVSSWTQFNGLPGGASTNDGMIYQQALTTSSSLQTNGIDFADDLVGVVSPGPYFDLFNDIQNPCLLTTDGGRSWSEGADMSESWGIYALKGTTTFFALPEGNERDNQTQVIRTTDIGRSWTVINSFPRSYSFTGHIAGSGNTLYVQTADGNGMLRSDDLGISWKNITGPSNQRDTRFVVTGCKGEVVYAFDAAGGIWKTVDGGDGTLLVDQVDLGSPEPMPNAQIPFHVGDTVRIPVYLRTNSLPVSSYALRIGLNTDFLSPIGIWKEATLSSDASNVTFRSDGSGATIEVFFDQPKTIVTGTALEPLCYVLAAVYLARDTTTRITIDSFTVNDGTAVLRNILTCNVPSGTALGFLFEMRCGDPTLYHFIRDEPFLDLSYIRPNPNATGTLELGVQAAADAPLVIEAIDMLGNVALRFDRQLTMGTSVVRLPVDLPSGVYYFRLSTPFGVIRSHAVAFVR